MPSMRVNSLGDFIVSFGYYVVFSCITLLESQAHSTNTKCIAVDYEPA